MKRLLSVAAVLMAAMLWGTTGTVQSVLPADREPLAVGVLRLVFGAIFLISLALANAQSRSGFATLPKRGVFLAGAAIGGYNLLFFYAVAIAGVGVGTAITIGSAPIWATLWETLTQRKLPDRVRLIGQAASIIGVALLGLAGGAEGGNSFGVILALGSGACYACYSLATSQLTAAAHTNTIAAATFSVAAILTLPALAFVPLGWIDGQAILGLVFLGFVATGVAYALYTWGLTQVAASTAVTLALAEPVTAWLLATFFVGEPLSTQSVIGAILILCGLVVVTAFPAVTRET
ncbi:DMT family transporter [Loktanella sp. S4079]|uniref:DMT family transporter n=1 Tax=Loktanella sp. S4079 TaxID=579483 RepID=UPI00061EEDA9|nr:DMT family transporter [Loktanella sp. S4079]KJZ19405.1 membrane protein [Loktanella sp. S4079]